MSLYDWFRIKRALGRRVRQGFSLPNSRAIVFGFKKWSMETFLPTQRCIGEWYLFCAPNCLRELLRQLNWPTVFCETGLGECIFWLWMPVAHLGLNVLKFWLILYFEAAAFPCQHAMPSAARANHAQRRTGKPRWRNPCANYRMYPIQRIPHNENAVLAKKNDNTNQNLPAEKKSGPAFVIPVIAFMRLVVGGNRNMAYTSERVVTFARWSVATSRLDGCKIWAHCSCSPCPCIKTHFG